MSALDVLAVVCVLAACANGAAVKEIKLGGAAGLAVATPRLPLGVQRVAGGSEMDSQIVGGRNARDGEFPHQASMQVVMPGTFGGDAAPQHICGGTLIGTNWVLTAAHCAYGVPSTARRVDVVVGISDLSQAPAGSQRITVVKMLVHGQYDSSSNGGVGPYDIALLKLSSHAWLSRTVKLAYLPIAGSTPLGNAVLSGWGSTSQDGRHPVYPNKLQTAIFPVVSYQTCYNFVSRYISPNPLANTNLCVGPLDRTGLSSCSGDSGGPLIQKEGNEAVVVGVVSWGLSNCGSIPFPSVFTRVSAYVDWITTAQRPFDPLDLRIAKPKKKAKETEDEAPFTTYIFTGPSSEEDGSVTPLDKEDNPESEEGQIHTAEDLPEHLIGPREVDLSREDNYHSLFSTYRKSTDLRQKLFLESKHILHIRKLSGIDIYSYGFNRAVLEKTANSLEDLDVGGFTDMKELELLKDLPMPKLRRLNVWVKFIDAEESNSPFVFAPPAEGHGQLRWLRARLPRAAIESLLRANGKMLLELHLDAGTPRGPDPQCRPDELRWPLSCEDLDAMLVKYGVLNLRRLVLIRNGYHTRASCAEQARAVRRAVPGVLFECELCRPC